MSEELEKLGQGEYFDYETRTVRKRGEPSELADAGRSTYIPNPNDRIPDLAVCSDCGDTTEMAGRFRKAEPYEESDEDGEIYECSTCGCIGITVSENPELRDRLGQSNQRINA